MGGWGGGGHMVFGGGERRVDRKLTANWGGSLIRISQSLTENKVNFSVTQEKKMIFPPPAINDDT